MPGDRYLLRARDDDSGALQWGDRLRVRGPLFIFAEERGGIGGSVVAEEVEVLSHTSNPLIRAALGYRRVMREQTEALPDEASAALIQGMALGDYRLLRARDLKDFRVTGLIHLCAASGLHLAILAGFVVWLGRRARLPPRLVLAAQAPILITYALAVGLSVPVTRATVVALLAAAAYLLGRDFDLLPATGAAVIILVWNDPGAAAGVSFQLCFAAAMGIALLHRPVRALMGAGRSKALDLLAVTAAAQLAVGPIILHHFGEVSLLAPLSNLLVLPLVPAVMGLSMLSSLFGTAGLPLAGAFMRAAAFLSRGILTVAQAEALWPHTDGRRVQKTRYRVRLSPSGDEVAEVAEVDVYDGPLAGLCTVEVEFATEDDARAFAPPEWFGTELTGDARWTNAALARHGLPRPH